MYRYLLVFFYLLITISTFFAQEIPPINVFSTEDYSAENQNWSITQGDNNFIYVANYEGLLEYNGSNWQLFPTPNETIMRSVYYYKNKIYSGFYLDFGFWQRNEFGLLEYNSLVKTNNIEMLEDEQIWEIVELDGWMLFKSLQRIYLYNLSSKEFKVIGSEKNLIKLSRVENSVYFQEIDKGIFIIENGKPKLISDNSILKNNKVVEIFKWNNKLLFLTQKNGFFYLEDNRLIPWYIPASNILNNKTIYSAKRLANNGFAIGTISDGMIYLDESGSLNYQITQGLGLSNNTVLCVFEDIDNNLWLGLDNGINTINLTSPFKLYSRQNNVWGTIYTSIIYDNNLYLGTNQGLYYRALNSTSDFTLIANTEGQVWNLQNIDDQLFCSHDSGTIIIKNNKANYIQSNVGTWGVKKINQNTLLQGSYDGLYVLNRRNGKWLVNNKIESFSNSSRYFLILEDNRVFVNHEYKGVFKLKLNDSLTKATEIVKDNSVEKGIHSSLLKYNNAILYACKKGVYVYDNNSDSFKRNEAYSKLMPLNNFLSAKLIHDNKTNKLWSFTKQDIRYLIPGKLSNQPKIKIIPIKGSIHKGASGYENIIKLKNNKYLIGTSNGYITIDLDKIQPQNDFYISINKVLNYTIDGKKNNVDLNNSPDFTSKQNNIEFLFGVPNYNKTSSIHYSYILEGLNEKWSPRSNNNSFLFENLPSGDYTFKVIAFIDNKQSLNEASYSFTINKPWYLSSFFQIIYILLAASSLFIIHYITKKYYRNQKEQLLESQQKELELKELENSQKIIKLNNERLRNDIDSKNRELATSTMSIIKKNDFLNKIKEELISGGKDNVQKVVRIIDKNLNNTDDWKMFQEAFNNADKNFIDKVKSKHPELTPNDLRLCAYLRLNLSSKEIAPLLNISTRSVEVKRYRLRKKMQLEHNANLTDYIMSL
ncbi:MAG: LuxR family transcriptional regulator [Flavobacteriaceae bacterium]|nr:LuxR family transcriptional regulator [Flavobacteriaceae bacterium]